VTSPERFGRYILLDRINVGGMAEVFRGKTIGVEGFERMVALKRILPSVSSDPDFIEMFVDEAKIAVQLQHANIAQTYDLGKVGEQYYIAMEYVRGVDLKTIWDRSRRRQRLLPIAMSAYVVQKIAEGLDFAHRKTDDAGVSLELVHRDVSPHNILCSFDGEVKLIDFGIAKVAHKVSKTQAGALKGKFGYMSPEQIRGIDLDRRTDVFACGTVLYELLVGHRAFKGGNDFSILERIRKVDFVPPRQINHSLDPQLERIILRALEKDPKDRYPWASDLAGDLQRYLFESGQSFGRTELVAYMQQHFAAEQEDERQRQERYKAVAIPAGTAPTVGPSRAAPTAPIVRPRPDEPPSEVRVSGHRTQTAPAPQPRPSAAREPIEAAYAAPTHTGTWQGSAPASEGTNRTLPTWAAMVIGGLAVVVVLALAGVGYLVVGREGALTVQVSPASARIVVDGRPVPGPSPVRLDGLTPGEHLLEVKADGHRPTTKTIVVQPGRTRLEIIELSPLPEPAP
jgi:serine/threonine protein kinase